MKLQKCGGNIKMSMSVNGAFSDFFDNVVNIKKFDSDMAKSSRDYLICQINNISKNGNFIRLASQYNCFFGSFSRKTKICIVDDIDLIIGLDGKNLIFEETQWDNITLKLRHECNDNVLIRLSDKVSNYYELNTYQLNSSKVKNKLVSELNNIPQYEKAEIHARGEAVTLKLKSYTWNFDIVPAFFYTDKLNKSFFLIPNGNGKWKKTNPKIEQNRITEANIKFNGTVIKTVRLIKYWNKHGKMPNITSYVLETMALDYFDQAQHSDIINNTAFDYAHKHFKNALRYISNNIFNVVHDSKKIQGNINNLTYEEKQKIHIRAYNDYRKAQCAIEAEVDGNYKKSINIWREIFGDDFPKYG